MTPKAPLLKLTAATLTKRIVPSALGEGHVAGLGCGAGRITLALIVCGVSLIAAHFGGLYWLVGAHVAALLAGLLNAWVFLLVAGAR